MKDGLAELSHNILLQDLAVVMIVAGLVTLVFHRMRLPVVLGYILAGVIIGPYLLPFPLIEDQASIETLSQLGVIFLMFSLGLEFSLRKLRRVGITAVAGASVEILAMLWIGYYLGQFFGWGKMDSIFLGAILSISSTTITIKVLTDLHKTKTKTAHLCFGILIVEDILAIAMIAVLSGIATTGSFEIRQLAETFGKILVFLTVVLVVGLIAVPPLIRYVARYKSDEMLLVTVLGLCFGISLVTVKFGYSVALGAFLIGTIIGEAREIGKIKVLTEPVRDMFSAVFFVAIGLMIDPILLAEYAGPVAVITVVIVVGKILSRFFGVFIAGHDTRTALGVGMTLAQIGEFSFIIAALGQTLNVTSKFLYPIAVCVSAITTLLTPFLVQRSDDTASWFDRTAPRWLVSALALYSNWSTRVRAHKQTSLAHILARKWVFQMGLNMIFITGIFLLAAAFADRALLWWPALSHVPEWIGGAQGLIWIVTTVLALPGLIATGRKLQAFAMLIAEASTSMARYGRSTGTIQTAVTNVIFLGGLTVLGLWVLVVSAPFLPTGFAFGVVSCVVVVIAFFSWRFFIQIHAKAQIALAETLAEQEPKAIEDKSPRLQTLLSDAHLQDLVVTEESLANGKLIRELELRTRTGATVVGIERDNTSVINPSPEEELRTGDRLFLLGDKKQIESARNYLNTDPDVNE